MSIPPVVLDALFIKNKRNRFLEILKYIQVNIDPLETGDCHDDIQIVFH